MGDVRVDAIKDEVSRRVTDRTFIQVEGRAGRPGRLMTTREMRRLERETVEAMREGQRTQGPLASAVTRQAVQFGSPHLNAPQRHAVDRVLATRDQIVALEGVAGVGKTTALAAIREGAEWDSFRVEGFAPTSRAAQKLADAGIPTSTLQRHLTRGEPPDDRQRHLYVVDESSLASTRHMHDFLHRLGPQDRVLLVGDTRQHQAVEAGRPFQQLQDAGMETVHLDTIIRQDNPALKQIVEQLARGDVPEAIRGLEHQGGVHEVADQQQRYTAIAKAYAEDPNGTIVISPDNHSRSDINDAIHRLLQQTGQVQVPEHQRRVLVPRQDVTGADRQWAAQYEIDNVVRYARGSNSLGLTAGEYARVTHVDAHENRLTVTRQSGERVTYDPRRLQGVTLYREMDRAFAVGDRVQFTAPDRNHQVANRELATLEQVDVLGRFHLRLESGRSIAMAVDAHPHLDYGYAVTSHSGQGQTANRVLVHVDTARGGEALVNRRLAYVALSRGRFDAQIYTDDATRLGQALNRDVGKSAALDVGQASTRLAPIARGPSAGRAEERLERAQ
jgi:ATP-dependent exoDNAse (exonuclease V) alpha subunit